VSDDRVIQISLSEREFLLIQRSLEEMQGVFENHGVNADVLNELIRRMRQISSTLN
jgi:hypothetical protein